MLNFPDLFHIERIRSALWRGREFGQASVMVGAGLSLNARTISPAAPSFPTWSGLSQKLVDGLYPNNSSGGSSRQNALSQASSTSGAMRLAEEYQAAFGRDALDRFLLAAIPDASYEPSPLHSLLLKLPWSDVFTTNYDTLLERAGRALIDRKYDVIRTTEAISGSSRPRIVKLHGSFPSNRPFIITEDDFRTYPQTFAPFVNLIQQSMLESTFCLVGFSGDDPNFLHWSGWVRDNLGKSSPVIYLCGLLDLSNARRKMLQDRNVVPVDLTPLFPPSILNRHAMALEWFFKTLDEGRWIPAPRKWPFRKSGPAQTPVLLPPGMPEIPTPHFRWYSEEGLGPETPITVLDDDSAADLIAKWAVARTSYPGWVVAPADNRDRLWFWTDPWIQHVLQNLSHLTLGRRFSLLYELNWRLEICLVPLWPDLANRISEVLGQVNPFEDVLDIPGAVVNLNDGLSNLPPAHETRRIWIELAHACLRFFRETQDDSKFEFLRGTLQSLVPGHPGLITRIRYQECLFCLTRIDHAGARLVLNDWSVSDEDPFWLIRQAAILVELGELVKAEERAQEGLRSIRGGIQPGVDDLAMLSREGWAMKLVSAIKLARSEQIVSTDRDFLGRWERLTESGCNPNPELELMQERLKRPRPFEQQRSEIEFTFDIRWTNKSYRSGESLFNQLVPALQAIRLVEEAAYPHQCGRWILSKKLLVTSITWIKDDWPGIAIGLIFRLADQKVVEEHFHRNFVAVLPQAAVLSIHRTINRALLHAIATLSALHLLPDSSSLSNKWLGDVAEDIVNIAVEVLSRIAFRLPAELASEEVTRAVNLYMTPVLAQQIGITSTLKHLFERGIISLDAQEMKPHLLEIFSLPIPGVGNFHVAFLDHWPEPTEALASVTFGEIRQTNPDVWSQLIQWLLSVMSNSTGDSRRRASLRLGLLWEKRLLTASELDQFTNAIWSICDTRTRLPALIGLMPSALLRLPEPEEGLSATLIKQSCLSSDFVPLYTITKSTNGADIKQFTFGTDAGVFLDTIVDSTRRERQHDSRLIKWNKREVSLIYEKISNWWRAEGRTLAFDSQNNMSNDQLLERYQKVVRAIREVLLPYCRPNDHLATKIRDLAFEFDSAGLPVLSTMPALLRLFPELEKEVVQKIRIGFSSASEDQSHDAIGAFYNWALEEARRGSIQVPDDLLRDFSSLVSNRRVPALFWALSYGKRLVEQLPSERHHHLLPNLILGLNYLLEETKYRIPQDLADSPFPLNRIPGYRSASAQLAVAISGTTFRDDPVIKRWLEAIVTDPVPEIRRACEIELNG